MSRKSVLFMLSVFLLLGCMVFSTNTISAKSSLKISYNGKVKKYKGKKIHVSVDTKSVTKSKPKGIFMKGTSMVSYIDVFKKGAKVKCTYQKSTGKITLKKNGVTIKMWVGKKTAYVNGKKKKLKVAPVKVKYIRAKKTKVLIPAKFTATSLKYKYSWSSKTSKVTLTSPFKIKYDGKVSYYTGPKGNLLYNNKKYTLAAMPAIKIKGVYYLPAKEVFAQRMGMGYSYDSASQTATITDKETGKSVAMTVDSATAVVNGTKTSVSAPLKKVKRYDTKKTVVCIPASFAASRLGYSYSWDKNKKLIGIHKLFYFDWSGKNTANYDKEMYLNVLTHMKAAYDTKKQAIAVTVTGTNAETMAKISVVRTGVNVIVTIPSSLYDIEQTSYAAFGDILKNCQVTQDKENTILTFTGESAVEYAHMITDKTFTIYLSSEYIGSSSLTIGKPAGVTFNMVSNTDLYNSNKFQIHITGNHTAYYAANPIGINSDKVKSANVSLDAAGNTVITVTTTTLQGYKIYDREGSISVKMGNPRDIYSKIVVLDAGHGGHDPGAVGNGMKEKDLNLKMMVTLMKPYFSSNAPDIKAYWTRSDDTFITLSNRAAFAKKVGADIFVSLHMNSWTKSSVNGTEVYYSSSNNSASFSGITSKKMASLFEKRLVSAMGTNSRGVSSQKYTVVHKNTVPAVLCELGFISGASDAKKLGNATYQALATKALYDTIVEVFNTYPTGR